MFNRTICIILLACTCSLIAEEPRGVIGEIILETINAEGETYKFEVKPVSGKTIWCHNVFGGGWYIVTSAPTTNKEVSDNQCYDNNYVFFVCYRGSGYNPRFWLTLNKITIYKEMYYVGYWQEIISFYIDYRDCRYPTGNGSRDIALLINGEDDEVYYAPEEGPSDCDITKYTQIDNGETLNFWEVNEHSGPHDISCFCPTPTLESITNHNNHPKVTWSHADDPNGSYSYEV